jgi:hypothetical protein
VTRVVEKIPEVPAENYDGTQDEGYQIALRHFFLKLNKSNTLFCALELHALTSVLAEPPNSSTSGSPPGHQTSAQKPAYRVFVHTGSSKELLKPTTGVQRPGIRQIYKLQTIAEAESLYQHLYQKHEKQQFRPYHLISSKIGSDLLSLSAYAGANLSVSILPKSLQTLVQKVITYLLIRSISHSFL